MEVKRDIGCKCWMDGAGSLLLGQRSQETTPSGGLRFSPNGLLYNAGRTSEEAFSNMEVEAYRVQYSYDKSFPGKTSDLHGINVHSVGNIWNPDTRVRVYPIIYRYSQKLLKQK